jgi:hypothetical protein
MDQQQIRSKSKAINALLLYAIRLGRSGRQQMVDMPLHIVMASNPDEFIWNRAEPFIVGLSNTRITSSTDLVIILASPYAAWHDGSYDGREVVRWAEAASAPPYTEEVGQSRVDTLLHIASVDALRPHIPLEVWARLKEQPSLPVECSGRSRGSSGDVVRQVRALGDIEILKSYLLLVWSEWDLIGGGLAEMQDSVWEDFRGIEMRIYRRELIERLDYVLQRLDGGVDYLQQ